MREYNNQDVKINETELDPCIAAEIRMKKALFSQRTRRNLLFLFAFIAILIIFSILLFLLLSQTSSKGKAVQTNVSVPEANSKISHSLESSITTTTPKFSTMNDSSTKAIDASSPNAFENDNNTFQKSIIDAINSTLHYSSMTTVITAPITTVTTTVITQANIDRASVVLVRPTSNNNINPMTATPAIRSDKQTDESITPSSFVDDNDEIEDCKALFSQGKTKSGIYQIFLPTIGKFNVLCDMKTNGGGWTVIQKRQNGQVYFANRTWNEYENGFGDLTTSFWLGLNKIHALTAKENGNPVTLRIELRGDLCEDKNGCSKQPNGYWWGEWDFNIGDASQKYSLSISSALAGNLSERTITDRFYYMNNGKSFTTIDQDNDKFQGNCAQFRDFGGWWHNDCGYVALNGRYGDRTSKMRNMFWFYGSGTRPFINYYIKPRETEMKLRSKS
ncbi:Fibrinogen beta and gamma chains C-terminal globular domain family protein [Brugia pahangi]